MAASSQNRLMALVCILALALNEACGVVVPTIQIATGVDMPIIGLGSCCGSYNVSQWLALGATHIDTSVDYGSEPNISQAFQASQVDRSTIFITSKINSENYSANMIPAIRAQILEPLNMSYVDLLLLHHAGRLQNDTRPRPACFDASNTANGTYYQCRIEAYGSLLEAQRQGLTRAIGVSNFEQRDLQQLYDVYGLWPAVNQIENHPYYHNDDLIAFCKARNITLTGYAPMGAYPRSTMLDDPVVHQVAEKRGLTPGQVALAWSLQKMDGHGVAIPRSHNATHMASNLGISSVSLEADDMAALNKLPQQKIYATQCQPWC